MFILKPGLKTKFLKKKHLQRWIDGSKSSETLSPVTLVKRLKAVRNFFSVRKLFFFFLLKASVGLNFRTLAFINMIMKSNTNSLKQIERKSDAVGMKECGIII